LTVRDAGGNKKPMLEIARVACLVALAVLVTSIAAHVRAGEPQPIRIAAKMDGTTGDHVPPAVKTDCTKLGTIVPAELARGSAKFKVVDDVEDKAQGRVMTLEITHMRVTGGGVYSGPKVMTVEGELLRDGKVEGSFTARRGSMRRARACKLLEADERTIAKDILEWLKSPSMDAKLGDAK
jgi:hypothetical protein